MIYIYTISLYVRLSLECMLFEIHIYILYFHIALFYVFMPLEVRPAASDESQWGFDAPGFRLLRPRTAGRVPGL